MTVPPVPEVLLHLAPGTGLGEGIEDSPYGSRRYLVGRVLGYGSYGCTYIGIDLKFDRRVAIKEYLPSEFSTRAGDTTVLTVLEGDRAQQFADGLKTFRREAERLAAMRGSEGVVQVLDFFDENHTAYMVMELLEGQTLVQRHYDAKTALKSVVTEHPFVAVFAYDGQTLSLKAQLHQTCPEEVDLQTVLLKTDVPVLCRGGFGLLLGFKYIDKFVAVFGSAGVQHFPDIGVEREISDRRQLRDRQPYVAGFFFLHTFNAALRLSFLLKFPQILSFLCILSTGLCYYTIIRSVFPLPLNDNY